MDAGVRDTQCSPQLFGSGLENGLNVAGCAYPSDDLTSQVLPMSATLCLFKQALVLHS